MGMAEFSVEGLEFIVLGSAVLAVAASLTDTADFAEGLSSRLLGVDNPPSPPEPAIREKEVRVRNPVTGRWIRFGGPTYSKLVSQGLLVEGAEVFEQPALTFSFQYQRTVAGDPQGIKPREGSVAVVHYICRLDSLQGPIVATSLLPDGTGADAQRGDGSPRPFVFEVGDTRVMRALDEAVRNITEGEEGILTIPPHLGYTSPSVEPRPGSRERRQLLGRAQADRNVPPVLVMELQMLRVLPLPPRIMFASDGRRPRTSASLSPDELQDMLKQGPHGDYFLRSS